MFNQSSVLKPLAAAALLAAAGAAQADFTLYTSQASFLAAVQSVGVDGFDGFNIDGVTISPMNRSAGAYGYRATAEGNFYGAGTVANPWLTANIAIDSIVFSNFSGGANAIGGNFFGSDIEGAYKLGDIMLVAVDSLGIQSTQLLPAATVNSFLGFVSTGTLVSLTLSAVMPPAGFVWPTVDNLAIGIASPVPEVQTCALMLGGLGLVGFLARRRG